MSKFPGGFGGAFPQKKVPKTEAQKHDRLEKSFKHHAMHSHLVQRSVVPKAVSR